MHSAHCDGKKRRLDVQLARIVWKLSKPNLGVIALRGQKTAVQAGTQLAASQATAPEARRIAEKPDDALMVRDLIEYQRTSPIDFGLSAQCELLARTFRA